MSNQVGHLERLVRDGARETLVGEINLASVQGEIVLLQHHAKRSEKSPDYEIQIRQGKGYRWAPHGDAWVKKDRNGKEFISATIASDAMPKKVYVNIWIDDEQPGKAGDPPSQYTITWSPPMNGSGAPPPHVGAGPDPELQDEIPY